MKTLLRHATAIACMIAIMGAFLHVSGCTPKSEAARPTTPKQPTKEFLAGFDAGVRNASVVIIKRAQENLAKGGQPFDLSPAAIHEEALRLHLSATP